MSEDNDYTRWKVPELRQFLIARGVTVTQYRREELMKLAACVREIALPSDPDFRTDNAQQQVADRLAAAGCPPTVTDPFDLNFSGDFSNLPDFGLVDIFNYLLFSKADYDKQKLRA